MNNRINLTQWKNIIDTVTNSANSQTQVNDTLYIGSRRFGNSKRYFCYDNYDQHIMPGLDFVISDTDELGNLTVFNASEQASAPISLEQGKQIARNFFNEQGQQMSKEIVQAWVMNGNASSF